MGDGERRAFWLRDAGQSLVEFALLVPILLIVFLGAADVGRLFFYTSMISNAAREGAIYAANNSAAPPGNCSSGCVDLRAGPVYQHVCDASGAAAHAAPCPVELKVAAATYGPGHDAVIVVTYDFSFIVTSLASRLIPSSPLTLRASSTFQYRQ
jgi:hypothetical protein